MTDSFSSAPHEALVAPSYREFCGYCGSPPSGATRRTRVCDRCHLGMVLRTPADDAVRRTDLFLMIDRRLVIQGISREAEAVLLVDEPEGVSQPVSCLLSPAEGPNRWGEVSQLVTAALTGTSSARQITLRTAAHPIVWFMAQISSCGPPAAALLTLSPMAVLSRRGAPA